MSGPAHPRKIRVAVIFGSIPLYGQEKGNLEVMRTLSQEGVEPRFLIHRKFGHQQIQPELDRLGFTYEKAPFGPGIQRGLGPLELLRMVRGLIVTPWALLRLCRRFKPDVLYLMNPLYAFYVLPALMLLRQPLVYRMGDEPAVHNGLYRLIWSYLVRRIKVLVVNSDFIGASAQRVGFDPKRIRKIYSVAAQTQSLEGENRDTVKLIQQTPEGAISHTELKRDDSRMTILYIGQIASHKGVHLAVEACMNLLAGGHRIRLLIAGEVGGEYGRELVGKVNERDLETSIVFLGFVKNTTDLWQFADLHVLPSIWEEPLANSVVEAKSVGVPSIIFKRGGTQELIRDEENGRCLSVETAEALAGAIQVYVERPDVRTAHGQAAKSSEENKFSREQFAEGWIQTFDDVDA